MSGAVSSENRNLRNIVLNMLVRTLENGELSHRVLQDLFADDALPVRDRAFVNRLYSGTLEKLVYLDAVIDLYSTVPVRKQKPVIRNILRLGAYQIRFMDAVPHHSAIDEAVKLARKRNFYNLTGFVNAVLRKIAENRTEELPEYVQLSVPEWIYSLICRQYGTEDAVRFFRAREDSDRQTIIRLNLCQGSQQDILDSLTADGCKVRKLEDTRSAYEISGFQSLTELKAFRKGQIVMQDPGAMLAVETAAGLLTENRLTVDVCAAPGGKALYLSELFPKARVLARDLSEQKAGLIRENMKRLGAKQVIPQVFDATVTDPELLGKADLVIADLPCSGLGVLKRKPDILYRLKETDLSELQQLQRKILKTVQEYVKPGGILAYSTCTVNRGENEEQTAWFLSEFDYKLEQEQLLFPGRDPYDGFYIACFRKGSI